MLDKAYGILIIVIFFFGQFGLCLLLALMTPVLSLKCPDHTVYHRSNTSGLWCSGINGTDIFTPENDIVYNNVRILIFSAALNMLIFSLEVFVIFTYILCRSRSPREYKFLVS